MLAKTDIEKYFLAEKQLGQIFLYLGIAAIIVAVVCLLVFKTPLWKGIAIPVIVIGLIQSIAGFSVFKSSDQKRVDIVYAYDMDPDKLNAEYTRMEAVNKRFQIIKIVELVFFAAAMVLIVLYRAQPEKYFLVGIGIGLFIQVAILYTADSVASKRAFDYTNQLKSFLKK